MTYVSNSPQPGLEDHSRIDFEEAVRIYALPGWVYSAFTSKFNLSDIHIYEKLRQVASIVDVAQIEILTRMLSEGSSFTPKCDYSYALDSIVLGGHWKTKRNTVTDEEKVEIASSVMYYLDDKETKASLIDRLTTHSSGEGLVAEAFGFMENPVEDKKPPYKVVILNESLYIIVEEGFLSYMETLGSRRSFLTQVLKSAYAIAPIGVVNRSVFYEQYVKALAE